MNKENKVSFKIANSSEKNPLEPKFLIELKDLMGNFRNFKNGARVTEVEEPISRSVFIQIEFNEVVEPKGLSSRDLARLVKTYGSYVNAGKAIGASEAFVRQNCFKAMPV